MTHIPENARLADKPLEVRREAELACQQEIADGLMRRHVIMAEEARILAAVNLARFLQLGRTIGEAHKL